MDLTPGPEMYDAVAAEMSEVFRAYTGTKAGQNMWDLDMEKTWWIVAKHAADLAYRAGREEAARDIEAAAPEPLINISGRSSKPTADEAVWFARLMAYGHAASIARGGSDG